MQGKLDAVVIGHYTQDQLIYSNKKSLRAGGPPMYISALFEALGLNYGIVSKIGKDFKYFHLLNKKPLISKKPSTRMDISYLNKKGRALKFYKICENINPEDINFKSKTAIVSGVIGEVLPETIKKISKNSETVFADIQGFIRKIDNSNNAYHVNLEATAFYDVLDDIDFLKMSEEESKAVNIKKTRKKTKLIITKGEKGCTIISKNTQKNVPTKPLKVIDSTGAGDLFLAGFVYGHLKNYSIEKCAKIANHCGGLALKTIGAPKIRREKVRHL